MTNNQQLGTAELLFNCAAHMGLRPAWVAHGGLITITTPVGDRHLYHAKSTINSQLGSSLTTNKLTTRQVMQQYGLPNIAFLNTPSRAEAEQFLATHARIIVKPLKGSNSRDVRIVDSPEQLADIHLPHYILEKYIAGKELRYLVLDNRIIGVHESKYGESVAETRDLKRISYPESAWDAQLTALALKTAAVLGLRYAAVDYLIGAGDAAYILEVNSSPSMKWFHAPTSGPKVDVARLFLETMLNDLRPKAPVTSGRLGTLPVTAYS